MSFVILNRKELLSKQEKGLKSNSFNFNQKLNQGVTKYKKQKT